MLNLCKRILVPTLVVLLFPLALPSIGQTVNYDLSGNWDWTDATSDGTTFQSTAVIDHDVGNGTFTWVWGNAGGNGTVSGTGWTLI